VLIVMEASGHYWKNLFAVLAAADHPVDRGARGAGGSGRLQWSQESLAGLTSAVMIDGWIICKMAANWRNEMDDNLEGGCACAAVRYWLTSAPMFVHCCHPPFRPPRDPRRSPKGYVRSDLP
jgi:hypothetical protein